MKTRKKTEKITKKMTFADVLHKHPQSAEVFMSEGMHCVGCPMSASESIEEGCLAHGLNPDKIIEKINKKLKKK